MILIDGGIFLWNKRYTKKRNILSVVDRIFLPLEPSQIYSRRLELKKN